MLVAVHEQYKFIWYELRYELQHNTGVFAGKACMLAALQQVHVKTKLAVLSSLDIDSFHQSLKANDVLTVAHVYVDSTLKAVSVCTASTATLKYSAEH